MVLLRKIKERIKKIIPRGKAKTVKPAATVKPKKRIFGKAVISKQKEAVLLGTQEVAVGKTKFSTPAPIKETRLILEELPVSYGKDKIALQIRDTHWLHTYWEVTGQTFERLKHQLANAFNGARMNLRVYDVSHIVFNGTNAHRFFDLDVGYANSWYVETAPGRSWCVDIGLLLASGEFIKIARSNIVYTPLDGPSSITDEEWMIPEEMFARLYGMGFGFGRTSPVGKAWQERMKQALFSGALASPGMASMASPVKKVPKQRKFWFWVNTELIVYGGTEPDAKVTVQGKEIPLRPDGTFSLRFALPDGKQVIPCQAVAADKLEEQTITPIVTRETK